MNAIGLWIALGALAGEPQAARGPVRLAVVPVIVSERERPASSPIFAAVWSAARSRSRLAVMSEEETFVSTSAELSEHVADCGPDTKCVSEQLRAIGIGVALMIVINLDLDPPLLGLQLIDCERAAAGAESIARIPVKGLAAAVLINEIRDRAAKIFDEAGFWLGGRLLVDVKPPDANVRLAPVAADGKLGDAIAPERAAASSFFLAPGRYRALAASEGYEDGSGEAEVKVGEQSVVRVALIEKPKLYTSFWFWAVIGAVVAGGTTAALIATKKTDHAVCAPFAGVDCGSAK